MIGAKSSTRLKAFHLPGREPKASVAWTRDLAGGGRLEVLLPELGRADLEDVIGALAAARARHLAERPLAGIVSAVDRVARRFLDEDDELRRTALESVSDFADLSLPMTRLVLDRMATDWRADALWSALRAEFRDPGALDGFVHDVDGRQVRAFGPALTVHIFSGNVPGVSVTSLIRALLVKSASLGKTAADEPLLAPLFARALADVDPVLGDCLAVTYWRGGDDELEPLALARADAVIAYGGSTAIDSLRVRTPSRATFHAYPHRVSFGVIAREALTTGSAERLARDAALAVATFDQQGCVSPHLFYVEEGGAVQPWEWSELLADALADLERELPRGRIGAAESAAIRQLRGEVEVAQLAGGDQRLIASAPGTDWTVVFDPGTEFEPSCLNRFVRVRPIASIDEVPALVEPIGTVVQTVGVAGSSVRIGRLADALGRIGASRVSSFSAMPWPRPSWHHDGRPPLAALVRWCDLES